MMSPSVTDTIFPSNWFRAEMGISQECHFMERPRVRCERVRHDGWRGNFPRLRREDTQAASPSVLPDGEGRFGSRRRLATAASILPGCSWF
jgi:hypothetical protein